jgi:hypothetical protein
LKKDDITRTKALEELKEHVFSVDSKKETLDDGFLEAWVCEIPVYISQHEIITEFRLKYTQGCRLISLDE